MHLGGRKAAPTKARASQCLCGYRLIIIGSRLRNELVRKASQTRDLEKKNKGITCLRIATSGFAEREEQDL